MMHSFWSKSECAISGGGLKRWPLGAWLCPLEAVCAEIFPDLGYFMGQCQTEEEETPPLEGAEYLCGGMGWAEYFGANPWNLRV